MSFFRTFSSINTFMSLSVWPEWLKRNPVGWFICLLLTYHLCSCILSFNFLWLSPIYWSLHWSFWHSTRYTMLLDSQLTLSLIKKILESIITPFTWDIWPPKGTYTRPKQSLQCLNLTINWDQIISQLILIISGSHLCCFIEIVFIYCQKHNLNTTCDICTHSLFV